MPAKSEVEDTKYIERMDHFRAREVFGCHMNQNPGESPYRGASFRTSAIVGQPSAVGGAGSDESGCRIAMCTGAQKDKFMRKSIRGDP
jgi:hypothetical protein